MSRKNVKLFNFCKIFEHLQCFRKMKKIYPHSRRWIEVNYTETPKNRFKIYRTFSLKPLFLVHKDFSLFLLFLVIAKIKFAIYVKKKNWNFRRTNEIIIKYFGVRKTKRSEVTQVTSNLSIWACFLINILKFVCKACLITSFAWETVFFELLQSKSRSLSSKTN